MITEIMKNIYMIELPFPVRRVKSIDKIKIYLIKGDNHYMLIDTGLNEPTYETMLREELKKLDVDLKQMDLFISHMHPDHCGLSYKFKRPDNHVYASKKEADIINRTSDNSYWYKLYKRYRPEGLNMSFDTFFGSYPPCKFLPEGCVEFDIIEDGDQINIGDYGFECIILPGHGVSHACLYEPNHSLLISCDVLLSDVAPILFFDDGLNDPLGEYLKTLSRLESLKVERILPCHGNIDFNMYTRINEIRQHYLKLCSESIAAIKSQPNMNVHQITDHHTKHTINRNLNSLSSVSYWFFFIPICMCVNHLAINGDIARRRDTNEINIYNIL